MEYLQTFEKKTWNHVLILYKKRNFCFIVGPELSSCINVIFAWSENKATTQRTAMAAREWRSLLRTFSLFYRFFASTFSIEFICRSHLGRGTCIMDGSRVLKPSFPILRVPFYSPRSTCVSRPARPSPSRWQFPIPIAPPSLFPSHWTTSMRKSHRTQNHQEIIAKDIIK